MKSEVFWTDEKYPGRIALVAPPRGGEWLADETAAWADAGLDVIVSMLEAEETKNFELEREAEFCRASGIEFISFPVGDRSVPALDSEFLRLTEKLKKLAFEGKKHRNSLQAKRRTRALAGGDFDELVRRRAERSLSTFKLRPRL